MSDNPSRALCALGASVRDVHETYSVLLDLEGNEF